MTEAERICEAIPEELRPYATELAENVIFQCKKLAETRAAMDRSRQPIVVAYDNGGGQRGMRKHPIYEAYNQLMANYRKSLAQLTELLQTYGTRDATDQDSPLAQILAQAESMAE
jgi:hypothetical protein